jgi:hypothetical protein
MEILLLTGLLAFMIVVPVGVSIRRSRATRGAYRAFYRDGYMHEEMDALRTQTQEIVRIDID